MNLTHDENGTEEAKEEREREKERKSVTGRVESGERERESEEEGRRIEIIHRIMYIIIIARYLSVFYRYVCLT